MGLDINTVRREKGITLEDLSQRSGVPLSTLKKISAGITTNPNLETVKAIAGALGCSLDDLEAKGIEDSFEKKAPTQEQGPDDEQQLIAYYKKASSYDRHAILRFAEYVVQSASEPSKEVIEEEAQLAAQSLVRQSYSRLGIQEVVK